MALGQTCVALGILLVMGTKVTSMPLIVSHSTYMGGGKAMPFVLAGDRDPPPRYVPDTSNSYTCPAAYRRYGDICVQTVLRKSDRLSYKTAKEECKDRDAEIATMLDLRNPNVLEAVVDCLTKHVKYDLMMQDLNSCVGWNMGSEKKWGSQVVARPCHDKVSKMFMCTRPVPELVGQPVDNTAR